MERIIDEVVAGLLEMCLAGLDRLAWPPSNFRIRTRIRPFGKR